MGQELFIIIMPIVIKIMYICIVILQQTYKLKMKIQSGIKKVWETEVVNFGYSEVCAEADINYRTLKRALYLGECKPYIYEAINAALIALNKRRSKKEFKLTSQDQD